jgi:hypothetical protein
MLRTHTWALKSHLHTICPLLNFSLLLQLGHIDTGHQRVKVSNAGMDKRIFFTSFRQDLRWILLGLSFQGVPGLRVKRPGRDVARSLPFSVEVKNEGSPTSACSIVLFIVLVLCYPN